MKHWLTRGTNMDPYWKKIGIGALCVFGVGMAGITVAKKGVAELKTAALGPVQEVLRSAPQLLTFRLDGRRLGQVKTIEVADQNGEWGAESVRILVELEADRAPRDLADCALAADELARRKDASFRCVTELDVADERLTRIGEVRFEPAGLSRPLYLARHEMRQLQRSNLRGLTATVEAVGQDGIEGNARYDIRSRNGRHERGTVRLDAADGRALIEVRDESGQEVFRLRADESGVSLNANDRDGARLLRLLAGEHGVDIKVTPKVVERP